MIYRISEVPPSVNMSTFNKKKGGRAKTDKYNAWIKLAMLEIVPVKPIKTEKYALYITIPAKTRGDIDNRIKAISDLLVTVGATPDDQHMDICHIERSGADIDHVIIEVVGLA